jgi:hypothetical protein
MYIETLFSGLLVTGTVDVQKADRTDPGYVDVSIDSITMADREEYEGCTDIEFDEDRISCEWQEEIEEAMIAACREA